jgi:hypothetical protein
VKRVRPHVAGLVATLLAAAFGYRGYVAFNDSTAAAYPAWLLVHRGTLDVPQTPHTLYWVREEFVNTGHGIYSDRPLGMIIASIPGQLFTHRYSLTGTNVLGAVVAGLVVYLFARLVDGDAITTTLATLGTPLLYVGGRTLWPETVGLACLLGVLLLRESGAARPGPRWAIGTFTLVGFATMCRPPLGLLILLVVAADAWSCGAGPRRTLNRCAPAAGGFVAGGGVLALYAHHYFGTYNPAGAYPVTHHAYIGALLLGLVSPARGLLFYSPWLLFVRPPGRRAGHLVLLAAAYTLGVWMSYDAWGGDGFTGYRYALPLAVLAAPWVRLSSWPAKAAAAWSVALGIVALTIGHRPVSSLRIWSHSGFAWPVLGYAALLAVTLLAGAWRAGRPATARAHRSADSAPALSTGTGP